MKTSLDVRATPGHNSLDDTWGTTVSYYLWSEIGEKENPFTQIKILTRHIVGFILLHLHELLQEASIVCKLV